MSRLAWSVRLGQSLEANSTTAAGGAPLFFTLATLSVDGAAPRARTAVYRKLRDDSIEFCTNTQSNKWKELRKDPRFEVCWYLATTREQFRLQGSRVEMYEAPSETAEAVWGEMSDAARALFCKPGTTERDHFGVIRLFPERVQLLELMKGNLVSEL